MKELWGRYGDAVYIAAFLLSATYVAGALLAEDYLGAVAVGGLFTVWTIGRNGVSL